MSGDLRQSYADQIADKVYDDTYGGTLMELRDGIYLNLDDFAGELETLAEEKRLAEGRERYGRVERELNALAEAACDHRIRRIMKHTLLPILLHELNKDRQPRSPLREFLLTPEDALTS